MVKTSIPMVNLYSQYLPIKWEIDAAILQIVESTQFINGPEVKIFEDRLAEYLGVKHVIACANGTDALQLAFMALGLEEGDEVITPSFTYAATAEILGLLKLVPVFVDVDPKTFNIDPKKLEKSISARTKAILPVHLFGGVSDMEAILNITKKYGLYVIEDNAQACGAEYVFKNGKMLKSGAIGDMGTLSFFPSKNLGCFGDGGAVMTNNDELAAKTRMIAKHGQSKKYHHDVLGCNSRLDTIQAAVLNVKLKYLDNFNAKRNIAAANYYHMLAGVDNVILPENPGYSTHVYHQFTIRYTGNRDALQEYLSQQGISSVVYYPIPLHMQKAFMNIQNRKGELIETEIIKDQVLSLPIDTEITIEQQEYICTTIKEFNTK